MQVREDKVCLGPQGTELSQLREPGAQRATNPAQAGQETSGLTLVHEDAGFPQGCKELGA